MARERRKSKKSELTSSPVVIEEEMPLTNGKEVLANGKINVLNGTLPSTPKNVKDDSKPLGELQEVKSSSSVKKNKTATGGSLAVLLTQGIMANDNPKIDSVLRNLSTEVITSTIRELQPIQVLPLLKHIETRLKTRKANDIRSTIRWAQVGFSVHMSYLCSLPNLEKEIEGLLGWLRSRISHQRDLMALQGKISTIADQIKKRSNNVVFTQAPLVVFNNDVDSDSEDFDTIGSDDGESSEDDWWDDNELKEGENEDDEDDEDDADIDDINDNDDDEDSESDHEMNEGSDSDNDEGDEDMEIGSVRVSD